jgi:hypothetical protein
MCWQHAVNSSDNHPNFSREWPEARMAKQSMQNPIKDDEKKSKKEEDQELSEELEMSFPASDPPSSTQPGGGITGAEPPTISRTEKKSKASRPS